MNHWPHSVPTLTQGEIYYFTNDEYWQRLRKSLKGLTTYEKLDRLDHYLTFCPPEEQWRRSVQVANYINALKRGGQLDGELKVQR